MRRKYARVAPRPVNDSLPQNCLSKIDCSLEVKIPPRMSLDPTRHSEDSAAAQQRFLSLFLRSEREIFRYVAALVPNVADAEDIVQQTALVLWEKFDAYDAGLPFTPWACRFALNKTRQWLERRQRWQALLAGGLAEELSQRREELRPEFDLRLGHLDN